VFEGGNPDVKKVKPSLKKRRFFVFMTTVQYLQDKNAGNLGDYIKHLYLIKLVDNIIAKNPTFSIAYIESHAGAGKYVLQESHWKNRYKYKKLICDDQAQWQRFNLLNPYIEEEKTYLGSFILAGKILKEKKIKSKIILYEKDKDAFERMISSTNEILPTLDVDFNRKPTGSTPHIIESKIRHLESDFDIVICLVDPYWKNGKEDSVWCDLLNHNNCILVFDVIRKPHKWHCSKEHLVFDQSYQIREYGIFGNKTSRDLLIKNC